MNKRLIKFLGLLLGIGILVSGLCVWYARTSDSSEVSEKDYLEAARRLGRVPREAARVDTPKVTNPSRPIRLAIGGLGLPEDARNRQLGDLIVASLTSAGGLELVERQSLDKVLREAELSLSSFVHAKDAVRVGGLLRADWFLLGGFLSLGGSNSLVVRIVDSQSGVMRDIGVFPLVADDARVAEGVAGFVRQHLQTTSTAKPRTYLAVGAMEDLSFNDRQAALPATLRSYLAAAYRDSKITTLEREYADTLLQEMYLELAALTQSSRADEVRRIQPAFWLVDGYYQSYETASNEVQCVLQVTRIFGRSQTLQLRGRSVEELFQGIKTAIDASLPASETRTIVPTKRSEISAQMAKGRETSPRVLEGLPWIAYPGNPAGSGARIRRRNLEEAIRAFQTVLLLDPDNHEAEMRLAACEFDPLIHRVEDARNCCQHLLGAQTQDYWTKLARPAMAWSYLFENTGEAARWFEAAAATCSDTNNVALYRLEAAKLRAQVSQEVATDSGQKLKAAETLLLANVDDCAGNLRRSGWSDFTLPFFKFTRTCRAEGISGDERLLALLPTLKERNPDFAPYLIAAVMISLQQTNGALVKEFAQSLEECANQPKKVLRPDVYFEQMSSKVYAWCIRQQRYELAAETVKCKPGLTTSNQSARLSDRDKASLAIAYQHLRKFTEALELLETLPRNPLDVPGQSKMVIPGELIAECQKELGTGGEKDAGQFQLAGPFAHLDYFADFATDEQGLWIASGQWLSQVSYSFHTNVHLPLPLTPSAVVMAICDSPDKLWVGCMRGGGLVEYDKKLRTCLHLGVKEGLLAEDIGSLHLQGERLWIGYYCGLGRMDLTSRQCAAFTPSLIENGIAPNWRGNQVKGSEQGPPIVTISGINASPEGVLWVLPQQPPLRVRRFRQKENQWDAVPDLIYCCSLASDGTHVFVGHDNLRWTSSTDKGKYRAGVTVANWDGTVSRTITKADGLPSDVVTTLTVDGSDLWIGGKGFVSVFDLRQGKIRKTSLVRTEKIKRIQIGGGFVWAQYDRHIYRASLADTL